MSAKWAKGVYLGLRLGSSEVFVATEDGAVTRARAFKRRPISERFDRESVEKIRGTPWKMDPTAAESVSELPRYPVDTRDAPAGQPLPLLNPGTATPHGAGGPYTVCTSDQMSRSDDLG
eukprot:6082200-Amphidinium_carterae.1